MSKTLLAAAFLLSLPLACAFAQNPDGAEQTAQLAKDSTTADYSELVASVGFDSRALVAGRDFDVQQRAFMPSLDFYHHSGAFAGVRGSLLSNVDPNYTQTTLQAGYGRGFGSSFYASATYQRFFFNPAEEGLLQNAVALFGTYSRGPLSLGASYTVLFEPEKAQQINLSLSGYFEKKSLKHLDGLSCTPNVSLLIGTESVALQRFGNGVFRQGTGRPWEDRLPTRPNGGLHDQTSEQLAPLSVTVGLPVNLAWGRLSVCLSANFVAPIPSKDEANNTEDLSNTAFFSASCAWTLAKIKKH